MLRENMRILLVTPPMTQVNTPYPATAYLTSFLRENGYFVEQRDLGIDLFHKLFSRQGLQKFKDIIEKKKKRSDREEFFLEAFEDYLSSIEPVLKFLKGQDPSLALRIAKRKLLPEGPRFMPLREHSHLLDLFGPMGVQDQAKYLASLYLDDIADIIKESVDSRFEFSRYGEQLASSQTSFSPLLKSLDQKSLVDEMLADCMKSLVSQINPDVIGFSLPFPGNVYGGLRAAETAKTIKPTVITVAGGGYVNTELRELSDPRIFNFFDYLTFDDGEAPLLRLLEYLEKKRPSSDLVRTWYLENKKITRSEGSGEIPFKLLKGPTYQGLPLQDYISMLEMPNPMHRLWSDFRWNKLILAHGCYWKKCTFCDVSLDYIKRFEPARVETVVDNIAKLIAETGQTGFHFVDEAAPPALLKAMSEELIKRNIKISWWGNLRFDPQFTPEVAELMADAGCVAVSGGLEVASPRILKLINKGTTVEQVAKVTKAFTEAGIYVHAYLMYGFPSQNTQETVDSLEVVRQLFVNNCLQSAHWHRFTATAHSPVGQNPAKYGIRLKAMPSSKEGLFAKNNLIFQDTVKCDHDMLGEGLRKALYNYMHGIGLKDDVRAWFPAKVPKTTLAKNFVSAVLH
jgi:radical SAM superfamily enzyme YgiQ (UPF0313 family)